MIEPKQNTTTQKRILRSTLNGRRATTWLRRQWRWCLQACPIYRMITWRRHQMERFSALALCEGNLPITGGFPSQRPTTRIFDVSLVCAWTIYWTNNRDAGDLRRHRAHYGVTVKNGCLHDVRDASLVCEFSQFLTAWRLVLSMKPWSYIWLEFGLFSTIIYIYICIRY